MSILTYGVTGRAARNLWLTDQVNHRSNHRNVASRSGGVIIAGLVLTFLLIGGLSGLGWPSLGLFAVFAAVFLGFVDDSLTMSASSKFVALMISAALGAYLSGAITLLPYIGESFWEAPDLTGYILSGLFLFGFVNVINFMDGLNGIAGGALLTGLAVLIFMTGTADLGLLIPLCLTSAALYGFLIRNIMKGGIFLGDAGSLGLGMLIGTGAIEVSANEPNAVYIICIVFCPFILDVMWTLVRRARRGASLFEGHKEHMYQRIRAHGWSHQAVALAYIVTVLLSAFLVVFLENQFSNTGLYLAALSSCVLTILLWRLMFSDRFRPVAQQS